jgi:hypothetical protein
MRYHISIQGATQLHDLPVPLMDQCLCYIIPPEKEQDTLKCEITTYRAKKGSETGRS